MEAPHDIDSRHQTRHPATWNRWENDRTHPPDFLLKVLQVAVQTWKREQTKQAK